jgi:hypothetical protein
MGIDVLAWRDCPLQSELGEEAFAQKLKLRKYKALADQLDPERRDALKITVTTQHGPNAEQRMSLSYRELASLVDEFSQGIPECAKCPLSGGERLGCYEYIEYPISESFETLVFAYFIEQVVLPDSACHQIYRDLIAGNPDAGAEWRENRGGVTSLTQLPEPLHQRIGPPIDAEIDSAQVLSALFTSLDTAPSLVAYGLFWTQFGQYESSRSEDGASGTLGEALRAGVLITRSALNSITEATRVLIDS